MPPMHRWRRRGVGERCAYEVGARGSLLQREHDHARRLGVFVLALLERADGLVTLCGVCVWLGEPYEQVSELFDRVVRYLPHIATNVDVVDVILLQSVAHLRKMM